MMSSVSASQQNDPLNPARRGRLGQRSVLLLVVCLLVACRSSERQFSGTRALKHVKAQCDFGPRPVGSEANRKTSEYIARVLERNGWSVEYQDAVYRNVRIRNVLGKRGEGQGPLVILATHLDTRPLADKDPSNRSIPVIGANDGASGVAVLLELSRVLDERLTGNKEIWLAFFDAKNRGGVSSWPCCVGSTHMANMFAGALTKRPEYIIVLDMVGDKDQRIYYEWNSVLWLQERIWSIADDLGYGQHFVPEHRYKLVNDHTLFLERGLPAALIIDFDYPYWRTRYDTQERISADSLQRVGDVLETLLEGEHDDTGPVGDSHHLVPERRHG